MRKITKACDRDITEEVEAPTMTSPSGSQPPSWCGSGHQVPRGRDRRWVSRGHDSECEGRVARVRVDYCPSGLSNADGYAEHDLERRRSGRLHQNDSPRWRSAENASGFLRLAQSSIVALSYRRKWGNLKLLTMAVLVLESTAAWAWLIPARLWFGSLWLLKPAGLYQS